MKYLLSSVAIVAALAITAPVSAQRTGPGPGAATGTGPGVTPPGGGLGPSSPLSNLPGPGAPGYAPPAAAQPPAGMAPGSEATSATPPSHRHAHHHGHVAAHHTTRAIPVSGNPNRSANQMNADELSRLQGGNLGNPPPGALPYGQSPGR